MLNFFLIFIGLFNLTYPSPVASEPNAWRSVSQCNIDNQSFKDAEELTYRVYYNWGFVWLHAANIVFKVKDSPEGYHVSAVGKTMPSYEWLYKVNDKYEAMIDKQTLLPKWSVRHIHENKYTLYEKMIFNQTAGTVTSIKGPDQKNTETKTIAINQCAHDILSILYYVRNYPFSTFKSGEQFPVSVFLDRTTNNLNARFDGIVKKKDIRGLGKFNAYAISPATIEGALFERGKRINFLISQDRNAIPLHIEGELKLGSIKANLHSYKNLRYPLNSKVD